MTSSSPTHHASPSKSPLAFADVPRQTASAEPVTLRTRHFKEYENTLAPELASQQSLRCMQCAVPFCHGACPTSNLIPEFHEAVALGNMRDAWQVVTETNPFPEITGRVCPAPCETTCCLGAIREPVAIKAVERAIGDWGLANGALTPIRPRIERRSRVTIVGSGPCGMAAAVRLREHGFGVRIIERSPVAGGLLQNGIPDFKLDKSLVARRLDWLAASGVDILTGVAFGDHMGADEVLMQSDALALAVGYEQERAPRITGGDRPGVLRAMDFLIAQNESIRTGLPPRHNVAGKRVIVIGGGDTGWDCVGTAIRQGAQSVLRLTSRKRMPHRRPTGNTWPEPPQVQRTDTQTEECATELYDVRVAEIMGVDRVEAVRCERNIQRSERTWNPHSQSTTIEADVVIVAQGFEASGSEKLFDLLGLAHAGGVLVTEKSRTNRPMIFAGGDVAVGPSLVVTAIRSGLEMADAIISYLRGG